MSGLGELGELPGFVTGGGQVQQKDIDQYLIYEIAYPSVSASYIGTKSPVGAGTPSPLVLKSAIPDYPRNLLYQITGVAGGMGGTITVNGADQFGNPITETCGFGTAGSGGSVQGTAIFGSITNGTVTATGLGGTAIGTATVGFSTTAGTGGNWFGLPVKVGGTTDLRTITWINNTTPTPINGGTNFGSLLNTTTHAFQGTNGLLATDCFCVTVRTTYDNLGKPKMTNL